MGGHTTASPGETPWRIAYADGSANVYRFAATAPDGADFEYVPVTPEMSSTGAYSGGEPCRVQLPGDDARIGELWRRVLQLEADKTSHTPHRGKGTGAFTVETPGGTRRFVVAPGATLDDFHAFAAHFRR